MKMTVAQSLTFSLCENAMELVQSICRRYTYLHKIIGHVGTMPCILVARSSKRFDFDGLRPFRISKWMAWHVLRKCCRRVSVGDALCEAPLLHGSSYIMPRTDV